MSVKDLFSQELKVTNIGSSSFLKDLDHQNTEYRSLEWAPPARGDAEIIRCLEIIEEHKDLVSKANDLTVERIKAAEGYLVGCRLAKEVVPGMGEHMILHSGPPVSWENMADTQKGAVLGAVVYEGWAQNVEEAREYVEAGNVEFSPNHHHMAVGPMAGIMSPSMPVHVIHDPVNDAYSYCTINEGLGGVLRFGKNTPDVIEKLLWLKNGFAPVLTEALQISGPIDVRNIIMQAVNMGDECHNRNKAATGLFYKEIATAIMKTSFTVEEKEAAMDFIRNNDHYFLNLSMPYCKLATNAGSGVPYSSIVTVMCRNAYEFGIKISSSDKWFTAPSPIVKGLYFPGYTEDDAARDLGDSAITETNGLGGFSMAASPAIVKFVGGTVSDAFNYSTQMNQIAWSNNPNFTLPSLDFRPTALGIDIVKVLNSDILPIINTGIAHKKAGIGQVGAGLVSPPYECFKKAVRELAKEFEEKQ